MDKLLSQLINEMRKFVESVDLTETKRSANAFVTSVRTKFSKEENHA